MIERGYSFEDMARARKEGFLDAVQVLRDVKVSESGFTDCKGV